MIWDYSRHFECGCEVHIVEKPDGLCTVIAPGAKCRQHDILLGNWECQASAEALKDQARDAYANMKRESGCPKGAKHG